MSEMTEFVQRYPAARIIDVAKALSGDLRLRILETLGERSMSISQLAETLGVAQPTITINIQMLEHAQLVSSMLGANREKICSVTCRSILLELPSKRGEGLHKLEEIHMPIGMYSRCSIEPYCGMVNREGVYIGCVDDPRAFYMPERTETSLLWFGGAGFVEYYFANPVPPGVSFSELRFQSEVCAEAPGFDMNWPSDISLFINDCPAGMITIDADYGDRKGKLTSSKWNGGTQYGKLVEWRVTDSGSYIGEERKSETTLLDLDLKFNQPIRVRIEVSEDAQNRNGLNLFGASFGDYPQDLILSFVQIHESGEEGN
ncbi:ArsR/SmtB family transcription factor [Paenibacillus nasutitermitis]|uniref:Transcriptional regulator n=1 Tax=Paenibacillus nasutitermitis TaxID=1652958 RepID=A0A916YX33_9BACL|nr:helix-turn-helix domain-containing protein [Paenibacillus nasutitermitis]GGD65723.1 transcriptional regulator [Paenibacillus nasutitermitis]